MVDKNETVEVQHDIVAEQVGTPTALEVALDSRKAIERISAIAQVLDGCSKVSIQRTNPRDWVRMRTKDGKESFYLQASGAQKIRAIWGIYFRDRQVTRETNPDGSYAYIVTGTVGSKVLDQLYGEVVIDIDGGRSSSDAFFSGGNRVPDPMDIRKAAIANWEARAITALLGMKNFMAADLTKNGINIAEVAGFEFQKGAEGGGNTNLITEPQRKRLFAICKSQGLDEKSLKTYLALEHKIDSTSKITKDKYEAICNWAQRGGVPEDSQGRQAGEGD